MPSWGPISRRELVKSIRDLGFEGPFSGGRHQFMVRGVLVLMLPNPHRGDIGAGLLKKILGQAGVSREACERICPLTASAPCPPRSASRAAA